MVLVYVAWLDQITKALNDLRNIVTLSVSALSISYYLRIISGLVGWKITASLFHSLVVSGEGVDLL